MTNCPCGAVPEFCGEHQPDNGKICFQCAAAFTCRPCLMRHWDEDEAYDISLCVGCNEHWKRLDRNAAASAA